jgi:hypothetical protein
MARPFALRLIEDVMAAGGQLVFPADGINRIVYVVHGAIEIAGRGFSDDESWQGRGAAKVAAKSIGATVWRWEFAPAKSTPEMLERPNGTSVEKLGRRVSLPASDVLIRNDSVSFPPGGSAFLHTHQGPGIRCLIDGGIRIDTEGRSASYGPGGAWFEGGPGPVFAQAAADRPTRFIRVMILPASLVGKSSIFYVNPEDREKPKSQKYKGYIDTPIWL